MKTYLTPALVLLTLLYADFSNAQTAGTLTFTYTPVAHSGNWGSKHVLAVWIQDGSDNFIKTEFRYIHIHCLTHEA